MTNFAIPGLMTPSAPNHDARGVSLRAGGLLYLGPWDTPKALPTVTIYPAARPVAALCTLTKTAIADCRSATRTLAAWLPTDIEDGDWLAEMLSDLIVARRVLFRIGKTGLAEIKPQGQYAAPEVTTLEETDEPGIDTIWQGTAWSRRLYIRDTANQLLSLEGYLAWAQLRDRPGGNLLATIATDIPGVAGAVDVSLDATISETLPAGYAWWDVLLQAPDLTYHRVEPLQVIIRAGVTQDA